MQIDVVKYPIDVFYCKLNVLDHVSIKKKLLDIIETYPEEKTQLGNFNKLDWVNSRDTKREWSKIASDVVTSYANVIGAAFGYCDPVIYDIWFQQYKKNHKHPWHLHGGQFVGVYYLELPDDAPRTQLIPSWNNDRVISVDTKEGDIILFPSMLVHQAPTIDTDTRKTIVSWNLVFDNISPDLTQKLDSL
jgi:hypothetical protein